MQPAFNAREAKGEAIAREFGWVQRVDDHSYRVHSQRMDKEYQVEQTETGWACSCPDSTYRGEKCKHVWAVEISWILRQKVEAETRVMPIQAQDCVVCGSEDLMKWGIRHNKAGDIQKFKCRGCGRFFTINVGFEGMKHDPKAITTAMQLFFSGESLRNTQKALLLLGVRVAHSTIYEWIRKYVALMDKYLDKITPQVSNTWRADEVFVKFKGNVKFVFALMDDQTRFWISQQVADGKFTADVRPLFAEAKRVAGKRPLTMITDGGNHFIQPIIKEFWTNTNPKTQHVRDIRLDGTTHNNKMERMNGEIRDREKVMRGLKRVDTPILKGVQLYHNYFRPHESLHGATPAEKAGIRIEGENKWLTVIQNAGRQTGSNRKTNQP